ncbi:Adhesin yadA precursor [Candidatus Bartonella washoeensis]|uniref:Surface protein/Bartonella adhesin n=1 Tax=Candidatus Bartonella washoeensis Sb944nv TaxID=1094563 RepID=J1J5B8_9HYPH|nr:Vomp family autotransporter [Bartonella washoeensis]EJF79377.1 hypothetical protein MCQ_00918 [Bartonella washoeensis Sb944nv]SPU27495.1 Adhesin yadA precursor [Bartonella washoeensis]
MKKLYSTQNWAKAVSLGTAMAALLSSVSPVFAANLAITGQSVLSTNGTDVSYSYGSHGSIVFAGDDDFCGADNVKDRGGKQRGGTEITAEEQYRRFIEDTRFYGRNPYGTTTEKVTWAGDGATTKSGGYMGAAITGGIASAMPEAYGVYSFVTGCGSSATGNYSTAFGAGATTKAGGAQAFGVSALAAGKASVAMGVGSEAREESTVAIGGLASALGKNSVAVGTRTKAEKNYAIAIGSEAEAQSSGAIAIGSRDSDRTPEVNPNRKVIAEGENSIAIGTHTYAKAEDSVAIGANAQVTVYDGVAIGGGSLSDREKGTVGYDPYLNTNSTEDGIAWKSTTGAFSVGEVGGRGNGRLTRQITGVAAGSEDTDAVNVAQLKAMRDVIAGGGGWEISVNDADSADVNAGNTVDFSVKNDNGVGKDNLKIEKEKGENKHTVKFALSDNLKLTSVTTGRSSMSDDGFIFTNGAKITVDGIDAGNAKITGVMSGTQDSDAVNYKQLKAVQEATKTSWQLAVNGGDAISIGPNGMVNLQQANSNNIKIVKDNNHNVTFDLNKLIQVNTIKVGDEVTITDNGLVIKRGPSITYGGIDAGDKEIKRVAEGVLGTDAVNLNQLKEVEEKIQEVAENSLVQWNEDEKLITIGAKKDGRIINVKNNEGGGRVITGVVDGEVNENSADAINGSQLHSMGSKIAKQFGGGASFENGVFTGPEYELTTIEEDGTVSIKNYPNVGSALDVVNKNVFAVDHKITVGFLEIADYFGGGAKYEKGEWQAPTFKVSQRNTNGTIVEKKYNNVADAFGGVDNSITDIYNQINDITGHSLVKWDEGQKLITIGKEKAGTKINITGSDGDRTISGVKAAVNDDEAVNKKQLDDTVTNITNNINKANAFAVLYDKNDDNSVNYNSVTLGGDKNTGPVALLNVKDGKIAENSHDAINGSQINKISGDVAKYFGGGASFENGVFRKPRYNLTTIDENSQEKQQEYNDVGSALTGLDTNIRHVNQHLIHAMNDVATYFGGGAGYDGAGDWRPPTFQVIQFKNDGTSSKQPYSNVANAFEGVNNSFSVLHNQISNITENSLVKQEGEDGLITVGKATGGNKISIANKSGEARTISDLKDGTISKTSTDAVNGSQLFTTNQTVSNLISTLNDVHTNISKYFGGSTDVLSGIEPAFLIQDKAYNNVTDAFTGVNISITNLDNKISEIKQNNLVQQEGGASGIITIGKKTAGTEISIAGVGGAHRTISGVKAAEKGDEAVNKDQLDKSIEKISKDIDFASASAVLYDKNSDGSVNYSSVTLGGKENAGPVALLNVKDGKIAENSHDAINGSQINKISGDVAKYFGGGASFENGAFKGPKYNLSVIVEDGQVAKANYYDVGSALTGLDANVKSVNTRITNVANDFSQKIDGLSKDSLLWSEEEQAFVALHGPKDGKTKSKLKFLLDGDIAVNSTDAITGNQLYLMSNQLAAYFGGGAGYKDGKWTAPNFKISEFNANGKVVEKNYNNVAEAFGGVNGSMVNINNRIDEIKNQVDSDALKWNKEKGAYDASHGGQPSKIINVADGRIAKDSKEAVNGGQLWQTNERITGVEKDIKHIENRVDNISNTIEDIGDTVINIENKVDNIENTVGELVDGVVLYDRDQNGKKTNKVTLKGGNESEPVLIDNVADGRIEKGSKEAVNGGQLHDYTQEQMKIVLDQSKHYTDQRVNNIVIDAIDDAVDRAHQYTDMKFNILSYDIKNVRKEARQAAAVGLAVSNLRYFDDPGSLSISFGSGAWRGQSAFALGAGYTSENGKIRSNLSATSAGGHWGVGGAITLKIK